MSEIFISYSNEDREIVQRLVEGLESQGWNVWWDHRIESGAEWDKSIEKALREAKCVIVLWTKNSTDSRWVRAEARDALKRNTLIPVMLEPDSVPLGFSGIQTLQLTGWEGWTATEEFDQLTSIIRVKLAADEVSVEPIKSSSTKKKKRTPVFFFIIFSAVLSVFVLLGSLLWMNSPEVKEFQIT